MNTSEFFTDEILQKWNNLMPSMNLLRVSFTLQKVLC